MCRARADLLDDL